MATIVFLGAGSTIFAKNVIGDCLHVPAFRDAHIHLVDIAPGRLAVSEQMVNRLVRTLDATAVVKSFPASAARKAFQGADYIVNAIQVGGYEPCTVTDFEIPKKYGVRQTIGDTLGIGGIFRALRTIPVMLDYCRLIEAIAPEAWLLNYANPMAMLTGAIHRATDVRTIGLCHSVQACAPHLCTELDLPTDNLRWKIAGINHQGWLLEITRDGEDLYPEIRRRAFREQYFAKDAVRFEIMRRFGYYVTESSEHSAEYVPWFIKQRAPELIDRYRIPLDEYPRRCEEQIAGWKSLREELTADAPLPHARTSEYASYILEAMETNVPFAFGGNVSNDGLIPNLPAGACVEVLCMADGSGIHPTVPGPLPPQCAALNRTNINVQEVTIEAALTRKREHIYQAALLDPHTAAELTIDDTIALCDDLIAAHGNWLPEFA